VRKELPDRGPYLDRLTELINEPLPAGVYICCFCEKDNLLSQWRSYGANGTGVSVQVDAMGFSQVGGADCPFGLLRLWKVFYDPKTQEKIIKGAIQFPLDQYKGQSPDEMARKAADAIQFFIPTFKNSDFSEESEWRLIFTPESGCPVRPQFRVGRNMLVPFYSLRDLVTSLNLAWPRCRSTAFASGRRCGRS